MTVYLVVYPDGRSYDVGTGNGIAAYVKRSDALYVCRRIGERTRPAPVRGSMVLLRSLGLDVIYARTS